LGTRSYRRRSWTSIWDQAFSVRTRSLTSLLNISTPYSTRRTTTARRIHRTTPIGAILSAGQRRPAEGRAGSAGLSDGAERVPIGGFYPLGDGIPPETLRPLLARRPQPPSQGI